MTVVAYSEYSFGYEALGDGEDSGTAGKTGPNGMRLPGILGHSDILLFRGDVLGQGLRSIRTQRFSDLPRKIRDPSYFRENSCGCALIASLDTGPPGT